MVYEFLEWQVRDVMSNPVTIGPETSIQEAEALLEVNEFNSLPVVDEGGKLVGLITALDILKAFQFNEDAIFPNYAAVMKHPVERIMSRDVVTTCPRTPLTRVLEKLVTSRNKSLPVVDEEKVVGVIARADVMEALRRADEGESPV